MAAVDPPGEPRTHALVFLHGQPGSGADWQQVTPNLLQPPDGPTAIEHRSVPAAPAAIVAVVDRPDILAWWQGALGELRATVRAQGLHATGPSGGVFASELFQQDRGQATVFIPGRA